MDFSTSTTGDYHSPFENSLITIPTGNIGNVLTILFFVIFFIWAVYTIIAAYHWFRYGHRSWLAFPAVAGYVAVSALCIIYIATGI